MPSITDQCCSKQFSYKLIIRLPLRIFETSAVVIKGVAITKYLVYRKLQVFDFDLSGETLSLCRRSLAFNLTRE